MLTIENIKDTLKPLYSQYDDIYKIGIAGSYATNRATEESDIDIVIEGDSTRVDIMERIKESFNEPVDVLWANLMKQEDEELDRFAAEMELPVNEHSVYKTVMREVIWV